MFRLALQEMLLPGMTYDEKLASARAVGADGIELRMTPELYEALPQIAQGVLRHDVGVAALWIGHTHLIHPEYGEREAALVAMRQAMAAAADLGADGVVFHGHYAPHSVLPDLHPYKSPVELEAELLVTMLRTTLCDLAYALDTRLLLAYADSRSSSLLRRPEHAEFIRQKLENHPHLFVASSLAHCDAEGVSAETAAQVSGLGYMCVCDIDGMLPGSGSRDWKALAAALRNTGYSGWVTVEGDAATEVEALQEAVSALRLSGF